MKKSVKKGKTHTIYAIYDEINDELIAASHDYFLLEMQLQLSNINDNDLSIIEFDICLYKE